MAAAAVAYELQADFTRWEQEFTPPESEIYGRSLSTIRRLGAFMINRELTEVIDSPEAAQARVEFYTSVEEGFGTDLELGGGLEVRDFDTRPVIRGRVVAKDLKTAISSMTESGLICAREKAKTDPWFRPQLVRSEWDHDNALIVDQMVRGETGYTTRIVISPFPEEAAAHSGDAYWRNIGYVPHLRRGFVQLYHATKDGLVAGSLSFDGSNKHKLREIFGRFGVRIPEGEITDNWLNYAITGTLSEEHAKALATEIADAAGDPRYKKNTNTVAVTKQYRPIMERAFNESYVHICESLARKQQTTGVMTLIHQLADQAHNFNERYAKALYKMRADGSKFTNDDSVVLHELLVYATIEMMRALHLQETNLGGISAQDLPAYLYEAGGVQFQSMLSGFVADGAKNNRGYSACGIEIFLGDKDDPDSPQSTFGGVDKAEDTDDLGSRWFTCLKGHLNYRRKANVPEQICHFCAMDVSCKTPELPKPKHRTAPPTWGQLFGIRPEKLPEPKRQLGRPALVGAST
jgi:hypothetical protein